MRAPVRSQKPRERGIALVLVLIFLSLMMVLGLGVTMTGITEVSVGANEILAAEAFHTADAGAVHAYELVRSMRGDFTALLRGQDGLLKTGDEFQDWTTTVPLYRNDGTTSGQTVPAMFQTTVNRIPRVTGSDSVNRALVRVDARRFYELIVYDNGNDPYAKIADSGFEVTNEPNVTTEIMTGGGTSGNPTVDVDRRVLIRSIGYVMREDTTAASFLPDDAIAAATVDIVLGMSPLPAVVTNGNLTIGNATTVAGALGSVHANDDLIAQNSGTWNVAQSATWSNNASGAPSGTGGTTVNPTSSTHVSGFTGTSGVISLPNLNPYDYVNQSATAFSHLIFIHADTGINSGTSYQTERLALYAQYPDIQAAVSALSGSLNGHKNRHYLVFNTGGSYTATDLGTGNATWTGSGAYAGVTVNLKNTGDIDIGSIPNPSSSQTPRTLFFLQNDSTGEAVNFNGGTGTCTIITNASVNLNGNFNMNPNLQLTPPLQPPWDTANVLILAGQDITGNGNPGSQFTGVIYAHEQFYFSGNANFTGQIIGYESGLVYNTTSQRFVDNTSSSTSTRYSISGTPINADSSQLTGNFTVTLNALGGFLGSYAQIGWRQLRDYDQAYARPTTATPAFP